MNQVLRHRLRNVVSGIKSATTYLADELDARLTEDERDYFPLMVRECDSVSELTSRLNLVFDEVKPGGNAPVGELVDRAVTRVGARFPELPLAVHGDAELLERRVPGVQASGIALLEALVNAAEAAPAGPVDLFVEHAGDSLLLRVCNPGAPLDEEKLAEIQRPFFTTRTRHLGVGWSVARRHLHCVGGGLRLDSPSEGGLRVDMTRPLSDPPPQSGEPAER